MAGFGDENGDGYADLAVGATFAAGRAGQLHPYLGGAMGYPAVPSHSWTGPDGEGSDFGVAIAR